MSSFGRIDGVDVPVLAIAGPGTLAARMIPWGAGLIGLDGPDRQGRLGDIVLGHDRLEDTQAHRTCFGATCGRHANRIAGGRFTLDGRAVQPDRNEGANHPHGARGASTRRSGRRSKPRPMP
jgi:aldose 1-epimerase